MNTPPIFERKVGATLRLGVQALTLSGAPADLRGVEVDSHIREASGQKKAAFEVNWIDRMEGRYELWLPGDGTTAGWAAGDYRVDIVYTHPAAGFGGRPLVEPTETLSVRLVRAETTRTP